MYFDLSKTSWYTICSLPSSPACLPTSYSKHAQAKTGLKAQVIQPRQHESLGCSRHHVKSKKAAKTSLLKICFYDPLFQTWAEFRRPTKTSMGADLLMFCLFAASSVPWLMSCMACKTVHRGTARLSCASNARRVRPALGFGELHCAFSRQSF